MVAADAALGLGLDRRTLSMLARQGSGSAARSLFGRATPVNAARGHLMPFDEAGAEARALVTVHPSLLLRLPDEDAKAAPASAAG